MKSQTESVLTAGKNTFRRLCAQFGKTLRRAFVKMLRNAIWRADEWCHEQELKLRQEAELRQSLAEVDPTASAAREKAHKRAALQSSGQARAARPLHPELRRGRPRLVYQAGQFVRS